MASSAAHLSHPCCHTLGTVLYPVDVLRGMSAKIGRKETLVQDLPSVRSQSKVLDVLEHRELTLSLHPPARAHGRLTRRMRWP